MLHLLPYFSILLFAQRCEWLILELIIHYIIVRKHLIMNSKISRQNSKNSYRFLYEDISPFSVADYQWSVNTFIYTRLLTVHQLQKEKSHRDFSQQSFSTNYHSSTKSEQGQGTLSQTFSLLLTLCKTALELDQLLMFDFLLYNFGKQLTFSFPYPIVIEVSPFPQTRWFWFRFLKRTYVWKHHLWLRQPLSCCAFAWSAATNTDRMAETIFSCTSDEQGWIYRISSRDYECQPFHPSCIWSVTFYRECEEETGFSSFISRSFCDDMEWT